MKTIALDCDGVLLDYNTAYSKAWFNVFGERLVLKNPSAYWPMERWNARRLVSNELEQFRGMTTQSVLAPAPYKTGGVAEPYTDARK